MELVEFLGCSLPPSTHLTCAHFSHLLQEALAGPQAGPCAVRSRGYRAEGVTGASLGCVTPSEATSVPELRIVSVVPGSRGGPPKKQLHISQLDELSSLVDRRGQR